MAYGGVDSYARLILVEFSSGLALNGVHVGVHPFYLTSHMAARQKGSQNYCYSRNTPQLFG